MKQNKAKREKQKRQDRKERRRAQLLRTVKKRRADTLAGLNKHGPNAKMIATAMASEKIRGDCRDYVLLVGDRLIDYRDSHGMTITQADGTQPIKVDKPWLVHKRNLHKIMSPELAARFWHPTLGRLGAR